MASVLRRTARAGDVALYARPGPPGSRQLDDRCKTFHKLFGLAGFFALDLDPVSGDRNHSTRAKGLMTHGIARGKVLRCAGAIDLALHRRRHLGRRLFGSRRARAKGRGNAAGVRRNPTMALGPIAAAAKEVVKAR